ncbi:hypothetical protein GF312_21425 [Candidatus Poribacteria bacterium]|nr:hypothetical protein [Candidatus Poribacteria bacterium]
MLRKLSFAFVFLFILSLLLFACGIRPQVDYYVNPVLNNEEQKLNEEFNSVSVEKGGLYISVSPVDAVDLMDVTSDARINPYLYVDDWGHARPRYTVFDVKVKNNTDSGLKANLSMAVLMDDSGEQYESISYEELRERYSSYPTIEREVVYTNRPPYHPRYHRRYMRPWYYHYDLYWRPRTYSVRRIYNPSYLRRMILKGTMMKPVKLYAGGKKSGLLVFPLVSPEASELKLIFPDVRIPESEGWKDVVFQFKRTPAVMD